MPYTGTQTFEICMVGKKKNLYYDFMEKRKKERNSYNRIIKNLNEHS